MSDGIYTENIDFGGKAITVISVNGAGNTTIDGGGSGSVVTFNNSETTSSVLDGFTITNGAGKDVGNKLYGGGIYCDSASPTIQNCIIDSNIAGYGGGIYFNASAGAIITDCDITDNTASKVGGGGDGGGIKCVSSSPTISGCNITGNTAIDWGGGIYCYSSSSPTITKCIVADNSGFDGGGISCVNTSSTTIEKSTIFNNHTPGYGGGISCLITSSPTVVNSIFWGDTATSGSDEIYVDGTSSISVTYSDVEGTYAGTGNIDNDPLFVDDDNLDISLRDYHLTVNSTDVIDAGTSTGAPADDIDDDTRDADPDMGSDEF